jgi:2-polyprenyl-6-methoxyphenol hydroxylase-like FAD-dependent oxidoreductase
MNTNSGSSKTQVVIIGAGPTGLSMAAQLLRYNIDFIIIEKNEKTTPFSKAVVVQARSLEIFHEIGIAEKAIKEGRITTALNLFYKGKQKAAINIAGLGDGLSAFPFALSLEQSKTEKLLVDHLSANGKTIRWRSEFLRFEQNENVKVYYKNAKDEEQIIEADYLVGCDGAGSLVRHQMGFLFAGDTIPKIFYVADVKLSSPVINKDELFIFLIKKGFVIFFPMEGKGHYRVIGILPDKTEADDNFKFEEIENNIKTQLSTPVTFEEVRWFSTYKVHSRKADSFMNGRCFIAGDAAHIHTPAGGQGMNTGIQDAYNLAWKIAFTLKDKVNRNVLESYNTERTENAKHLLRTTDRMFDMMAGSGLFWNFIRLKIFPLAVHFISKNAIINKQIFPLLSQTGIAYPNSTLTFKSVVGKVKAGNRMPYFVLQNGSTIFDYLKEPVFKILFFGNDQNKTEQLKVFKFQIATFSFSEIPGSIFQNFSDFYILLRPDNHISYIGKDLNNCKIILKKIYNKNS